MLLEVRIGYFLMCIFVLIDYRNKKKCYSTSGISRHRDLLCGTVILRVSTRPPGSQKPSFRRNMLYNISIVRTQYFRCSSRFLPMGSHLFAQPHLSRYYCDDVHFNNQQSAVESKTGEHFARYHGCQRLRVQLRVRESESGPEMRAF